MTIETDRAAEGETEMNTTSRTIAATATLAMVVLLFAMPAARSAEIDPGKAQDRVSEERFGAGLVHTASISTEQLARHGAARAARQDRVDTGSREDCVRFGWPNIPLRCLVAQDGVDRTQRNVRLITVETRVGENTSVLTRVPATVASR
jgi:hypothetical protein